MCGYILARPSVTVKVSSAFIWAVGPTFTLPAVTDRLLGAG